MGNRQKTEDGGMIRETERILLEAGWKLDISGISLTQRAICRQDGFPGMKRRYYCSENGDMLTNCITPDHYLVGEDGAKIAQ